MLSFTLLYVNIISDEIHDDNEIPMNNCFIMSWLKCYAFFFTLSSVPFVLKAMKASSPRSCTILELESELISSLSLKVGLRKRDARVSGG